MANKKDKFVEEITILIEHALNCSEMPFEGLSSDAADYWNALQAGADETKPKFTENGKMILGYMQKNIDVYNNLFKAKDIAQALSISSRTVSGGLRKLVTDNYVEKMGVNPVLYTLSETGKTTEIE